METSDIALQTFDSGIWRIFSCPRPAALFRVSRLRHEVTLSHTMLIITMLLYCLRVQILVTSVSQSVSTAELIWICESTWWCCWEHAVVLACWASVLSSWQIGSGSVLEHIPALESGLAHFIFLAPCCQWILFLWVFCSALVGTIGLKSRQCCPLDNSRNYRV